MPPNAVGVGQQGCRMAPMPVTEPCINGVRALENVNSATCGFSRTRYNFPLARARVERGDSMKVALSALMFVLAFSSPAFAQAYLGGPIDSRIDSNASTGTGVPTGSSGYPSSSSLLPYSGRVVIITKIPAKPSASMEQAHRAKPSGGG